ncbi:MAG: glycosyltransferase family 2 protein [Kiritimatiellae bacterium]|jgi:glycosyltransferase involved in cell wall biosynthesis|nr:glycosyltransferase family 2 protein [Kiritimatiellia bacterium]
MFENTKKDTEISVVIPLYKGEAFVKELYERLCVCLTKISAEYEIIFVNDSSPDKSWDIVCCLCETDNRLKGLNLSRNFGQHYAITAGLGYAQGEWIVVMDCDLQDKPEEISNLYAKACEGYAVVFAQRINREDSWFKRAQSKAFHAVFDYLTDRKSDPTVANFGIYHRKVIKAVLGFGDCVKCFPLIVTYVGFKTAYVSVAHDARKSGNSSYTVGKALRFAINLMLAYSNKPLRLFTAGGFAVVAVAFIISLYYLFLHLTGKTKISGFTSLIISVWFVGGMLMLQIGIVGVYLGRVFNQTKNRPSFVVDETVNTTGRDN